MNVAAYRYERTNLQVQTLVGGIGRLQNAASGRSYGGEISVLARITRDLTLSAGASRNWSKYTDYPNAASYAPAPVGLTPVTEDASGLRPVRSPKFTSNVSPRFEHRFADGSNISLSATWYHTTSYAFLPTHLFDQKGYDLFNGNVEYGLPGDNLSVGAWVSNITDVRYDTNHVTTGFGLGVYDSPPRMVTFYVKAKL